MTVVAYVPDLMDRSKVAAAGRAVSFAPTPAALVEAAAGADLVVVDLGRPGVLDVLPDVVATGARVVAFGSHVDRDTFRAATAAGCADVLPRSRFFSSIPEILNTP
jgi:DNA-binding NarL/FixJ family response regulator